MPVRKSPWVFVCLYRVSVCCEDHLCKIVMVVPRMETSAKTYCKCCVFDCACVSVFVRLVYGCKKETMGDCGPYSVCVCRGSMFLSLLGQVHVWMPLTETLSER